jgi:hypothetical protein
VPLTGRGGSNPPSDTHYLQKRKRRQTISRGSGEIASTARMSCSANVLVDALRHAGGGVSEQFADVQDVVAGVLDDARRAGATRERLSAAQDEVARR